MVDRTPFGSTDGGGRVFSDTSVMMNPEDVLSQRLELWSNATERRQVDEQANLYAIILSMEHLEQAYANDAMKASDYHEHCKRLISQFRLASAHLMRDGDESLETKIQMFMATYELDCPRAYSRLLVFGVPEPLHKDHGNAADFALKVGDLMQLFVTANDMVGLENNTVDALQPVIYDIVDTMGTLPNIPALPTTNNAVDEFGPRRKLAAWLKKLNSMTAADELNESEMRQLKHDLETAETELKVFLRGSG